MKNNNPSIHPSTQIELICIKEDKIVKKVMSYEDALKIKSSKKKGWTYIIYEIGFSQFN